MSKPMPLDSFTRLPARVRSMTVEGLSAAIDTVALSEPGGARHDYQWYAERLAERPSDTQTIVVEADGMAVIALPLRIAPRGRAALLGHETPGAGFPMRLEADAAAFAALVEAIKAQVALLTLGVAAAGDRAAGMLIAAARARGWRIDERSERCRMVRPGLAGWWAQLGPR
jgi:hypothetical protein